MRSLFSLIAVTALMILASLARSQASATFGAGPNGYDYMIGTWSCVNGMPTSDMGLPPKMTIAISKSGGALLFHYTGGNYDISSYNVYDAKRKMWLGPFSTSGGIYGSESTTQTGKTIVWTGTLHDPDSGKTMPTRDTFTNEATKYVDLGENQVNGTWKAEYRMTCTKT